METDDSFMLKESEFEANVEPSGSLNKSVEFVNKNVRKTETTSKSNSGNGKMSSQ